MPHKGCELRRKTVVRRLGQPPPDWHLPTFAAGYMKREPVTVFMRPPSLWSRKNGAQTHIAERHVCAKDRSQPQEQLMHGIGHNIC